MTQPPPQQPQAGWFPDPSGAIGQLRWWDGQQWTSHTAPQPGMPAASGGPGGTAEQPRFEQVGGPGGGPSGPGGRGPGGGAGPGPGGPGGWAGDAWPAQPAAPQRKGLGKGAVVAIVAVVVVLVVVAAGGAYLLLANRGGGQERPAASGAAPTGGATKQAKPVPLPVSYSDDDTGITMKLPKGWKQYPVAPLPDYSTAGGFAKPYPCPYGGDSSQTCYKATVLTGEAPTSDKANTPKARAYFTGVVVGSTGYAVPPDAVSSDMFDIVEQKNIQVDGKKAFRLRMNMDVPKSDITATLESIAINDGGKWVYVLFATDQVPGAPPASVFDQVLTTVSLG